MSVPYTSKHLTNLASEAGALSRKEQITIARAKNLFVKLQGDSTFAPDALAAMGAASFDNSWSNGAERPAQNRESHSASRNQTVEPLDTSRDVEMEDAGHTNGASLENGTNGNATNAVDPATNGTSHDTEAGQPHEDGEGAQSPPGDDASDTASQLTSHRMTTRARAHAASTPSPPNSPSSFANQIHPLFTFATESLPDRDFGLPQNEAEETRMLLMAYIQKQEEVARVTSDLYQGLLQADRMRQDVFKWCKAEAHVGEMSDGEDWCDNEEWGLDHDLIKGRDEEEDDTAATGKKSTRQRRKPDKEDR
jgi:hypothetical protein